MSADDTASPAPSDVVGRGPGRRTAVRRHGGDPVTLLTVAVPLLTVLIALLVHADGTPAPARPAVSTPLSRADVICPPSAGPPVAASLSDDGGDLDVTVGDDDPQSVPVEPRTPVTLPGRGGAGVVVTGRGAVAPGLVAGRFTMPLTAADCREPVFDQWFTGVGAGPKHGSTLLLVNPDSSGALVDVDVFGADGPVAVPDELRGRGVSGHQTLLLDLTTIVPNPEDLTIRVRTLRGRLSASVLDTVDRLDGRGRGVDLQAAQDQPRRTNLVLGLPDGPGRRNLVLTNPGENDGRASLQLITEGSTFAPEGLKDIVVPAGSAVRVTLGKALAKGIADAGDKPGQRAVGLRIDSTVPMTSDLLMLFGSDVTHATSITPGTEPVAAVLPEAESRLLLAGSTGPGVAKVRSWDAEGSELPEQRVELAEGAGSTLDLSKQARLVLVTPSRTEVAGVLLATTGTGSKRQTALVQLRSPRASGLVASVDPGLP